MQRSWVSLALIAVLATGFALTGCGKKAVEGVKVPESGQQSSGLTPEQLKEKERGDAIIDNIDNPKINENAFEIKPGTEIGYEPTNKQVAANLGTKIDEALKKTEPVFLKARLYIETDEGYLTGFPKIKIQNKDKFNIEYNLASTKENLNRLAADNGARVKIEDRSTTELPEMSEKSAPKMSAQEVENFAINMPRDAFRYYADGTMPWQGFIAGLMDPKSGFKYEVQEQELAPGGVSRKYFRIVANSISGPKREIELVIDSLKYVPVTMRFNKELPNDKKLRVSWTGEWQYGGTFTDSDFKIPQINTHSN